MSNQDTNLMQPSRKKVGTGELPITRQAVSLPLAVGFSGKLNSCSHPGPGSDEMLRPGAVTLVPLPGAGFACQAALGDSITDCLHSLPGAPRALPLRPVLNGCQQEEKLTKDRRPDFGGRGQGVPLDCRPHRTDPWLRPPPTPQSQKKRKKETSFE